MHFVDLHYTLCYNARCKKHNILIAIFLHSTDYDINYGTHNCKLSTPIWLLIIIFDSVAFRGLSLQHLFRLQFPLIHNAV